MTGSTEPLQSVPLEHIDDMEVPRRRRYAERWNQIVSVSAPDDEVARLGRLFNVLMVISTGIVTSLSIIFLLMQPLGFIDKSLSLQATAFPVFFIPLSLFCLLLAKRGRIRPSISLYVWVNFVAIGLAALLFDGVYSPAWILYIWTITIAGTLLVPLYALLMTGGVVTYYLVLLMLYRTGLYAPLLTFGPAGREFLDFALLLIMLISTVGLLTYLNMRSLRQTMGRLRSEIDERKRMVDALQESEMRFRTVADYTYDWEYWIGPDGTYIYVSPSCERITGYRPEEFISKTDLLIAIAHPDDREKISTHLEEVLHDEIGVCSIDFRIVTRDGNERWINHRCQSVTNARGEWWGRRGTNRDVTDERRMEANLRASEERYRTLLESARDIVFTLSSHGEITSLNRAFEEITGWSRLEWIGRHFHEGLVHADDWMLTAETVQRMLQGETPH